MEESLKGFFSGHLTQVNNFLRNIYVNLLMAYRGLSLVTGGPSLKIDAVLPLIYEVDIRDLSMFQHRLD